MGPGGLQTKVPECHDEHREDLMTKTRWIAATLLMASAIGIQAHAADVKIGVIYPLTGNAASAGQSAKDAIELGAEIVNKGYPELKAMPLGATGGLPNLGGAKIV